MVYMSVLARIMTDNNQNNFLTVAEVSGVLRLSELTIYKYIKSGSLEAVEFGGHYRISEASLNLFIAHHIVHTQEFKASGPEEEK